MKEVTINFADGSYYIVRGVNVGDTICGDLAHVIMFKMQHALPTPVLITEKVRFIMDQCYKELLLK